MDNQQRQKIILAVVAVVALGAGSWFVFLREPAQTNANAFKKTDGEVVRKTRATTDDNKPTRKKRKTKRATRKAPKVVRRERAEVEEREVTRKTRRKSGAKREKKKEVKPAA